MKECGKYCPTEQIEQTLLVRWADHHWFGPSLLAFANGGIRPGKLVKNKVGKTYRYSREGQKMKEMGVRKGVPDLLLVEPMDIYNGLFIEMKRKYGSTTSKEQVWYYNFLRGRGYRVEECKGWVIAAKVICDYLGEKYDVI